MPRYDIFPNPARQGFLLDVQSALLNGLNTRVVVPLLALNSAPSPGRRLNPQLIVDGTPHVMVTQFQAAVPVSVLKTPIDNVAARFSEITAAIGMLTQGL